MIQVPRVHGHAANLEFTFDKLVIANCSAHLIEPNREVRVLHLPGQRVLHGLSDSFGSVDVPLVSLTEQWCEERKAMNVVPMGMADEYVSAQGRACAGGQ